MGSHASLIHFDGSLVHPLGNDFLEMSERAMELSGHESCQLAVSIVEGELDVDQIAERVITS